MPGTRASSISSRRRSPGGLGSGATAAEAEAVALRADIGGVAAGAGTGAMPVLCGADTGPEGGAAPMGGAECVLLAAEEGAAAGSVLCMAPSRGIGR
ncbi:hypothetical protein GCM10010306_098660 [Streptomyces umbrinus]|nr:hypothetical protein GCM10010306_098660 [Streptomyces umbrinus]